MYGLLLESVQFFLTEKYGAEIWQCIQQKAGLDHCNFVTHQIYDDHFMHRIAEAAEKSIACSHGMSKQDFMQFFGVCFVKFFSHYGYDKIVRVSGRHLRDFLVGIDNLHEHIRFGYPKLQSPTFYCTEETSYGLTLHYVSKRKGFTRYVIGQVEEIAQLFYKTDINIQVVNEDISASQSHVTYRLVFDNSAYKTLNPDLFFVTRGNSMAAEVFLSLFPFSFVISPELVVYMAAECLLTSLGPEGVVGRPVSDIFTLRRPSTHFTWNSLKIRNVIFELVSKMPLKTGKRSSGFGARSWDQPWVKKEMRSGNKVSSFPVRNVAWKEANGFKHSSRSNLQSSMSFNDEGPLLHLKGEMKFIKSWNKILYICHPVIGSVEEMEESGLYMNDLGLHSRSHEMVLSGIRALPQLEYARDRELGKGKELEENMISLEQEKSKSDKLLYSLLPKPIAERMKRGARPIDTCELFEEVTILFGYLNEFNAVCSYAHPTVVIGLVNTMFVLFDKLCETHGIYKFETLGDAMYMAVSGVPEKKINHAEPMAAMALDMMQTMKNVRDPATNGPLTLSIGMHSGSVVGGVVGQRMPQYCLFGDTVNIASRLRTTSKPQRIHISDTCERCLPKDKYRTQYRGEIQLKGKGLTKTFWLLERINCPT